MSIGSELLRFNYKQVFCCGDFETTSVNLQFTLPWQIALYNFNLNGVISTQNRYIWWADLNMSADAARITNFNYQHYKDHAEDPIKVLKEIEDVIYDPSVKIVNQNYLGFDAMVLNIWRRKLGLKTYYDYIHQPYKIYDTLALTRAIKLGITPDTSSSLAFLNSQFKLLSIRKKGLKAGLGSISKELGVVVDESKLHDAMYDTWLVSEVFKKQIYKLELI